eukprot:CAMPEP_0174254480 /NCGR_PEP_ID=MMETSP0439-20130205/3796_1 /TAXON_ID=0 /ORGANISM="Stereomyxa ramosa, Strain Chinc5" /LENGTH=185 /DNA_ID=CAMNT_0015336083 /DNA_START=12 /DNA_END=566 /DNA_ORIENTATION=-
MKQALRPLVVAGPSGAGKSTLIRKLMDEFPAKFGFSVSHTTRGIRPGEEDGKHYHFVDRETFEQKVSEGNFIEHAEYSGNLYGTSFSAVSDVQDAGKICILDIDIQGVELVKQTELNPLFLFIVPPSTEELKRRLVGRGDTDDDAIQKRLETAVKELAYKDRENFWDRVQVNDDLETAYSELRDW